jgi:DNA-binding NarL/FixJ family response regulator
MILVAVDDFLFRSKIRATARQADVEVAFAKTPQDIIETVKSRTPSLVIFDLNSAALDPIGTIAAIKGDPALASVRTLGFVSHVDAARIQAARAAGADEVRARSAFAGNLAEILLTDRTPQP